MPGQNAVVLRIADGNDRKALWSWRRDAIHFNLFQGEQVSLSDHCAWFQALLRDDRRLLLIGWRDSLRIGAVALRETDRGEWQTNVLVKPSYLGQGVGAELSRAVPGFLAGMAYGPRRYEAGRIELVDHRATAEPDAQLPGGGA